MVYCSNCNQLSSTILCNLCFSLFVHSLFAVINGEYILTSYICKFSIQPDKRLFSSRHFRPPKKTFCRPIFRPPKKALPTFLEGCQPGAALRLILRFRETALLLPTFVLFDQAHKMTRQDTAKDNVSGEDQ